MGNAATIVMAYRLNKRCRKQIKNKENYEKNNLYNYLYGERIFKNDSHFSNTYPLLRKKKDRKDIQGSISG